MQDISLDIIVTSNQQEVLDMFFATILPTLPNTAVIHIVHTGLKLKDDERIKSYISNVFGNKVNKDILFGILEKKRIRMGNEYGYFGIFNDDLYFTESWLEDCLQALERFDCVSPGYIETKDVSLIHRATDATKDEHGHIDYMYGPCAIMKLSVFPKIGMLDDQFVWGADDLDLMWRLKINGLSSVTLKKVSIGHMFGQSRGKSMKRWNTESKIATRQFWEKHGIMNYRLIKDLYKGHNYFKEVYESVIT